MKRYREIQSKGYTEQRVYSVAIFCVFTRDSVTILADTHTHTRIFNQQIYSVESIVFAVLISVSPRTVTQRLTIATNPVSDLLTKAPERCLQPGKGSKQG